MKKKCFASFAGNFQMEKSNNIPWVMIGTKNFQTDSLKAQQGQWRAHYELVGQTCKRETKVAKTLAYCIDTCIAMYN